MSNQHAERASQADETAVDTEAAPGAEPTVSNSEQAAAAAAARGGNGDDGGLAAARWVRTMAGTAAGLPAGAAPPAPTAGPAPAMPTGLGMRDDEEGEPATGGLDLQLPEQAPLSPRMERFRAAIAGRDKTAAETEWMLASPEERAAFAASPSIEIELGWALDTLGIGVVMVMGQTGLKFSDRVGFARRVLDAMMPLWIDSMAVHGLAEDFVATLPPRWQVTEANKPVFDRLMKGSNSDQAARAIFERVYANLSDTTYDAAILHTRAWTRGPIERLYDAISGHLPLSHLRAVDAIYLGYEYKEKESDASYERLGHAWWSNGRVVMPEKSADDGGSTAHSMTGGGTAHVDPARLAEAERERRGKRGHTKETDFPGQANLFDVSALHEVGHAVGQRMGGNDWAANYAHVGWETKLDVEDWSHELWDDDSTLDIRMMGRTDVPEILLPAADCRRFLANNISGKVVLPAGWDAMRAGFYCEQYYGDQPLTKYWKSVDRSPDNSFKFDGRNNYAADGKVYVWLSRGESGFSRYQQAAHQEKVSWYAMSSPREWFAEQYAHYHLGTPLGAGLEPGTKAELDRLHAEEYADPDQPMPVDFDAGAEAGAPAPAEATTVDAGEVVAPPPHRLPFAW